MFSEKWGAAKGKQELKREIQIKAISNFAKIVSKKKKPYLIHFERKLSQLQASENERNVHNLSCKNTHASENQRNIGKDAF